MPNFPEFPSDFETYLKNVKTQPGFVGTRGETIKAGNIVYVKENKVYNWRGEKGFELYVATYVDLNSNQVYYAKHGYVTLSFPVTTSYLFALGDVSEEGWNVSTAPTDKIFLIALRLVQDDLYEIVLQGGLLE